MKDGEKRLNPGLFYRGKISSCFGNLGFAKGLSHFLTAPALSTATGWGGRPQNPVPAPVYLSTNGSN